MNAGASLYAVPSPIEGSGTAWVLLGSWALSPARPTPIHPRHECRGFSALLVTNALCQINPSSARQRLHRTRLLLYGSLLFCPYNTCTAVGHKKPMRRNARLSIPNAPLNQTRTVTPVMMEAEARTMAICTAADASS